MSDVPSRGEFDSPMPTGPAHGTSRFVVRRLLISAICLAGVAGVGYWIANWEWPAGPASGTAFRGPAESLGVPPRFKIGTLNIHGGYGLDGKLDLVRTASCLDDLDFVGLNEVRGGTSSDGRSQAEQLGEILKQSWLFAPTETGWLGPHFGQGALSRHVVTSWRVVPFPRVNGNGYRNYVEIRLPFRDHASSLTILFTHLDRKSDRQDQLRTIIGKFLEVPGPVVLMGDLNAKRTEPQLQELAKQPGVTECFGKFAKEPLVSKRIDWIFVRGLKCRDAGLEATEASDHPWGWADLELEK